MKAAQIYVHARGDATPLAAKSVTESDGTVTFQKGLSIDANRRYQVRMKMERQNGSKIFAFPSAPRVVQFQLCELESAPTRDDLMFAKMLYAEGTDLGEFRYIRDLVYNRIQWVKSCPKDKRSFGAPTVKGILTHPKQFASVLNKTSLFQELETELNDHSGPCEYTTSPRSPQPSKCVRINKAIKAVREGNQNKHEYVFFRSDTKTPSNRAVNRFHYDGGNYYWEISGCPGGSGTSSSNGTNESGGTPDDGN